MKPIHTTLMSAASMIALGIAATPALAQDAPPAPPAAPNGSTEEIVVTGLKGSLATAQNIRRNAAPIVDSIVAEDIGKFPDNTVADALQRVTGVQVTRGLGETTGVDIRGLPNIATLINGREVFTGTGRGVALQDIPAELLAGVDVYKTITPDTIEGGLVGTIDIRLHRPFDFGEGLHVAGSGRAVYSDQAKKWGYLGGGIVSEHWDTAIGEIGLMAGASYNRRRYRDDTAFDFVYSGSPTPTADTVGGLLTVGDRKRMAYNVAAQWKPSDKLEFYADGVYTQYKNRWGVNFFIGLPKAGNVTSVTPRSDGSGLAQSSSTTNAYTLTSKQAFQNKTTTWQADFGTKWHVADDTLVTSEIVYNRSRLPNRNIIVDTSFNAPTLDVNYDVGGTPHVDISGVDLTDPSNFYIRTLFDNHSLDTSRQFAWRGDIQHDFDGGFLKNFKIGARYTSRRATSQATASVPIGNPDPNGTPVSALPGFAELSPGGLVNGKLGVDRFVLGNENWMLANPDKIRTIFGYTGDRAFQPSLAFFDDEKTYAFYGQVTYGFDLGSVPVDGVAGVRVVNTAESLNGNGVSGRSNYINYLPSATLRAKLTDKLQARLAFSETINRPDFGQLNPLVTYVPSGQTGTQTYAGTASGGNPNLTAVKSTGYDAALEYYLNHSSSITATVFYHKFSGYIQNYAAAEQNGNNPDGSPAIYLVTRPRNTGSGKLYGAEVAYQQFFDFLPGALSGFGLQVNGSYLIGTTADAITHKQVRLNQVSRYSSNVVAMYEKYGLTARLAYNWRSGYIDSTNIGGAQGSVVRAKPIQQLDFSGSYDVNRWLTLTVDATNLLDRTYHDRFTGASLSAPNTVSNTPRDTRTYDRTFEVGARVKF